MSKKNKKKNEKNKDILVVLFVFAVIILSAVAMTMCGRDEIEIGSKQTNTKNEDKEQDSRDEIVIMATVGVAVVIVVCFAVKKANDTKKRNEAIRLHNQRLEDERRLAEAKERVRQARLQEMIDAGISQLTEKRGRRDYSSRSVRNSYRDMDNGFDSFDINDKRLSSYYRDKYDDLLDDYDDDLFDSDYDDEELPDTFFGRLKYRLDEFNSYWWVIAAVLAIALIGGLFIAFYVL